ncbi:MAG: hypothetical protein ACRDRG_00085 [Pseudonocardiaceae bacterium]
MSASSKLVAYGTKFTSIVVSRSGRARRPRHARAERLAPDRGGKTATGPERGQWRGWGEPGQWASPPAEEVPNEAIPVDGEVQGAAGPWVVQRQALSLSIDHPCQGAHRVHRNQLRVP